MSTDLAFTILFGVISVIGVVGTIYYGRKSAKLERERGMLEWADIQIAVNDLAKEISASGFVPDVLLAPGSWGGIIAHLLSQKLGDNRPVVVIVGVKLWKESFPVAPVLPIYEMIETNNWFVGIPRGLLESKAQNVLIVDDFAISGDALEQICATLKARGHTKEHIRTATVVVTNVAVLNKKSPNFYWKKIESTQFFFPWGRTIAPAVKG